MGTQNVAFPCLRSYASAHNFVVIGRKVFQINMLVVMSQGLLLRMQIPFALDRDDSFAIIRAGANQPMTPLMHP